MRHLLERLIDQPRRPGVSTADLVAEHAWWTAGHRPLDEAVRRGFAVRQLCLRAADGDGTWRNSVSYIGDVDPADRAVCTYDYDRAEIRYESSSPLARPYPWDTGDCELDAWYSRTGMAAITAWLLAVARSAGDRGEHLVLTNRLYHETRVLFDAMDLARVDVRTYDDPEGLLRAASASDVPVVVFLDSSRPHGDSATVRRVLRETAPERVGCVVWDNTCAPTSERPFDIDDGVAGLDRPLLLLRSHVKLDQLGLEFCSLGSIAMFCPPRRHEEPGRWHTAMRTLLPDCLMVTGGCASPWTLRLLDALGLPDHDRAGRGNRIMREANRLAGRVLAEELHDSAHHRVVTNAHDCFVELHLLNLPGPADPGSSAPWPPWDEFDRDLTALEHRAAEHEIPLWKSASFGFHYTGLSWYGSDEDTGTPHTVLRVCFGMHDPEVAETAARLVADQIGRKTTWTFRR